MSSTLNIRVTERELELIMDLLHEAGDRVDADGQPAFELLHDLMEQSGDAVEDLDPTDLNGRTFTIAENDFIDAGIQAREQAKATSMAADRRTMRFTRSDTDEREASEVQRHDLWDRPNDPTKW